MLENSEVVTCGEWRSNRILNKYTEIVEERIGEKRVLRLPTTLPPTPNPHSPFKSEQFSIYSPHKCGRNTFTRKHLISHQIRVFSKRHLYVCTCVCMCVSVFVWVLINVNQLRIKTTIPILLHLSHITPTQAQSSCSSSFESIFHTNYLSISLWHITIYTYTHIYRYTTGHTMTTH